MLRIRGDFGTMLSPDGISYSAQELTFHSPSDHTIMGKRFDLELQIVHKAISSGDITKKALLVILFEKVPGTRNKFFDVIDYMNLPNPGNTEKELNDPIDILQIFDQKSPKIKMFNY